MNKIRWGIVSTARIAQQFMRDMAYVANGEVVAVASRSQESAEAFAAQFGIPGAHGSYEALFDDPEVDAVYIATPHSLHFANTAAAIQARKHVLCEKPFTVSAREARNLFRMAEQSGVFVMEGMWTWFLPAVRKALEWVEEGRIGALRQVKADFGYPIKPYDPERREYKVELAGGSLLDMGIYPLALALLFTGRDPESMCVTARTAPNGVDDDVQMLFSYGDNDSGMSAVLGSSFRCKLPNRAWLVGEDSAICIPDFWRAREAFLYELDDCVDHFSDGRESPGFNFEIEAAGADILAGRRQNAIMPWSATVRLQEQLEQVMARF
jgi:predicted dehydrogenase